MANVKNTRNVKKRKRKVRSEAVVILTLGSLLVFLLSAMGLSLLFTGELPAIPGIELLSVSSQGNGKVVVIDPGHGGYDNGGVVGDVSEKDITLAIGLKFGEELKDRGYQVVYTRDDDSALGDYELDDLTNRVAIAQEHQGDVMISLHTNIAESWIQERIYGFEVFQNETNPISMELAKHTIIQLDALQYSQNRDVKDGKDLQVVAMNQVPSVLVEIGFLSDDGDRTYMMNSANQTKIAKALAEAVDQTLKKEET